ncbi:MAG: Nramp family divalent metal transporter [Actinobacteria bacterium]|nr:Nramp family divalent metal transporter [Actinomycetota bacterium]
MNVLKRAAKKINFRSIIFFLSILGPGIITANVDNDAGGITTYSLAGARYGYSMLWTLIPITIALIITQEMCSRMGAVTGKGLADLIRENYGIKVTFYLMIALFIANLGTLSAEFAGWAASLEIFGVNKYISVPIAGLVVWWLVFKGSHRLVERVFLILCTVYFTYVISGFMAKPDWSAVAKGTLIPSFSFESGYVLMLVGVIGTTITPWMQFYLQSAVVDKGITIDQYKASRLDVVIGCIITDIIAFFIIVTSAAELFTKNIKVETAADAAFALAPLAGQYAKILFAVGLANASLFAASILPLAVAYYICEGMGWEAGVGKKFRDAPQFFSIYTALIIIGVGIILIPRVPLLELMLTSQVVNGIMLPFVLIFILQLINKRELMGEYVNSRTYNVFAWVSTIIMIALTVVLVITSFFPTAI